MVEKVEKEKRIDQEDVVQAEAEVVLTMPEIPYAMRRLRAEDIPLFAKIVGKIGIDELVSCYGDEDFTEMLVKLKNRRQALGEKNAGIGEEKETSTDQWIMGLAVATRIANKVIMSLDECMQEMFRLVGNLAGITTEEVAQLDLDVFMAMIVKIITENNIGNFIKAARVLLK